MFFSSIADLLTLLATTLFPIFLSYKAVDPKKPLNPLSLVSLLHFWIVFATCYLLESTILYPFSYLPFYAWARLCVYLYLLLPAPHGATRVYNLSIRPFIAEHENEIELLVVQVHNHIKTFGSKYFRHATEWVRINLLNMEPSPPPPPPSPMSVLYMQQLLSRFYETPAVIAAPTSDMFGSAVTSLLQWAGDNGKDKVVIPKQFSQSLSHQREYLRKTISDLTILVQAFSSEENKIANEESKIAREKSTLTKSKSEHEFDNIEEEIDIIHGYDSAKFGAKSPSSWLTPWTWNTAATAAAAAQNKKIDPDSDTPSSQTQQDDAVAKSSGIDL